MKDAETATSMASLDKQISDIREKIDTVSSETQNLDDEIQMMQSGLKRAQEDYEKKRQQFENLEDIDSLMLKEQKAKAELKALEEKVLSYLELTEDLEEKDILDQEKVARVLLKEREEKETLLKEIRQDIQAKMDELAKLRENTESTASTD